MGENNRKKIAIVGAGISGLLACKYVLSKGFDPIVFESHDGLGGVWTETFETTRLQTPKLVYQFSDFPWPSSIEEDFPDHRQVLRYVEAYARRFNLMRHIRFRSKVVGLRYEREGPDEAGEPRGWCGEALCSEAKWEVKVERDQEDRTSIEIHVVDFVILCVGRFSGIPNFPEFTPGRGPESFHGKVIHSMDYAAMSQERIKELIRGKRVAVVGFRKSALDIAMECSTINGVEHPCTVLYRTEHWNVPDYLPWGLPLEFLYLNRFSELLVHKPGEGLLLSLLASVLSPVRWAISKSVESNIKKKLPLEKYGMVPKHSFLQEISSCLISTVPAKFYDRVEGGSIILKKAPEFGFFAKGISIDGDITEVKADVVIMATGFKGEQKLRDVFESKFFRDCILGSPSSIVPLYRECIHPRIPQLAVVGFSESVTNLYTSEMRCRWLVELLAGTFKLPPIGEMEKDVEKWDKYMKEASGKYYRRSCIGAVHIWYNDQLCKDMGWNPRRKQGLLAELFEPYGPPDYATP
ncbi:hypothetical protein MLD38_026757 [Melastoma candidum]|uniref:Uncharacterized protein n=1 Tax=Melastoma candidum TaxID=119954 RepID=A0ACB9NZK3_9MYRT|nr:hypothetical protein MLD38_026757 [Melastoma candidum]